MRTWGYLVLELKGLEVSYGSVDAVRAIDLTVGSAEIVALLGPNGAGKSSTLRAISQLVPSGGQVIFDGQDLAGKTVDQVAMLGLIHVPEGRHVFPTLSVHENLQIGQTAAHGRTGQHSLDDVYDLFPALVPLRKRDGFALSGGEQQMVAIGRALLAAPRLLLLDEPSLGLAPIVIQAVFDALAQISATMPMLIVEQNTNTVLHVCARAYVMVEGQIAQEGSSAEMSDRSDLIALYLGQSGAIRVP